MAHFIGAKLQFQGKKLEVNIWDCKQPNWGNIWVLCTGSYCTHQLWETISPASWLQLEQVYGSFRRGFWVPSQQMHRQNTLLKGTRTWSIPSFPRLHDNTHRASFSGHIPVSCAFQILALQRIRTGNECHGGSNVSKADSYYIQYYFD